MPNARRIADMIEADNLRDHPHASVWTAWFESPDQADLLIASLTAVGISAINDGGSQIVRATFKPGEHVIVAEHATALNARYWGRKPRA
jgi:hypothetical protein